MEPDVIIAGSGPAGLAAAAACVERGLRVELVSPEPDVRWVPTYCGFVDELPGVPLLARWPRLEVRLGPDEIVRLERPYGWVDGEALRQQLRERARGARFVAGRLDEPGPGTIDARGQARATLFQTAYGLRGVCQGGPEQALWMDFSCPFGDGTEPPSFLYALPLPDGTTLLEETSLASRGGMPLELLRDRLQHRLAQMGVRLGAGAHVEQVRIPLDVLPQGPGWPVRFGAAAGMVHPATGFLLGRVLRAAPALASALATADGPDFAARAAWAALWPGESLLRSHLYRYGASVLASLGAQATRTFFRAFFAQPEPFVRGYLSDTLSASELAVGMLSLFRQLPLPLRWQVLRSGHLIELLSALRTSRSQETTP
jgi:lycopene beta-cyclase